MPLREFVAELCSDDAAFGGGSVAALAGSLAAGLLVMVGRATAGSEEGGEGESAWGRLITEAEQLSRRLLGRVTEDTEAYEGIVTALRMPRSSEPDRRARADALGRALVEAASVPQRTLADCVRILELADSVAGAVKVSLLSDLGSASHLALAGARAAALNVEVNAGSLEEGPESRALIASSRRGLAAAESFSESFNQRFAERGTGADGNWLGWLTAG